jgi:tetratricopeptide (TPR) repeat protein
MAATDGLDRLRTRFRAAFREGPVAAFRDWFRLQEKLADHGDTQIASGLASDLWDQLPELTFASAEERGRFLHNVAVFFGNPGPAANLARARDCFAQALACFPSPDEGGWHARVLHNFATAISNLGESGAELLESVALYERALAWRTHERAIARGVTLHNLGLAWRRLAEIEPERASAALASSARCLEEAAAIREANGLAEGRARSLFHLGLTREAAGEEREARHCFEKAAEEFEQLGKAESTAIARARAERLGSA